MIDTVAAAAAQPDTAQPFAEHAEQSAAVSRDNPQFAQSEAKPAAPKISSKTVSQTPDAEAALLERIKKQM